MTSEQEEQLYRTVFFTWKNGERDHEALMERLREMASLETKCALYEAKEASK